ncbi:PQQ-binding-like beta-propeller repeat protein [Candidatus Uabimicrobium amorphum]|uniref:Alcohol dehydrogenase n=1 Tax=Uabimicrobium amorphum TaxID=2596890 RepID=A0A5S9IPM2_UABAM|nr:PQQ-binding-like beta-propeller repeat protein [Candidatus Uabimicrobium amorphum]BBM84840.1 alcohol dehydrogenase [Candidatus Uabimicrobium amorphum]
MRYFILLIFITSITYTEDWPCWRGANGNGIAKVKGEAIAWSPLGLKEKWRIPLGVGYACLSVYKDKVYTLYGDNHFQYCIALDAKNGKEIWRHKIDYMYRAGRSESGPQSTPAVSDGKVYAISSKGELWCLDAQNGDEIWHYNIIAKFGGVVKSWGTCSSPLIYKDKLLFHVPERGAVAVSKLTGETIWNSGEEVGSYATPIMTNSNPPYTIFYTGSACLGVAPKDGQILWRYPWVTTGGANAAAPIFHKDKVFLSADYGKGSVVIQINNNSSVEEVWKNKKIRNHFSSCILWKEHLYGFHVRFLVCFDINTGEIKWKKRGFQKGMITGLSSGQAIILGEKGNMALIELSPEKYIEKGVHFPFPDSLCRTIPTVANGHIFVRNLQEVVCLDLREN